MEKKYSEQILAIEKEIKKYNSSFLLISVLRLMSFCAAVILIISGFSKGNMIMGISGVIFLFVFIGLVAYHSKLNDKINLLNSKKEVYERYIARKTDEWRRFEDTGEEFITEEDTVARDLDLLGRGSIYQLINVAHTLNGRKKLAETVALKTISKKNIEERNNAITELSKKEDFIISFETITNKISKKKNNVITKIIVDDEKVKKASLVKALKYVVPLINLISIILTIAGIVNYWMIIITFILGTILTGITKPRTDKMIETVYQMGNSCDDIFEIITHIADENFESPLLNDMKNQISGADGIINSLKKLTRICQAVNINYNPILHLLLNGFLGWDYFVADSASRWHDKNQKLLSRTFDMIGTFEELMSLSVLSIVRRTAKPSVSLDETDIIFKNAYHPLLNEKTAVGNTAELSGRVTVITGSNMSGKTTFLRTVAVNLAISYMGGNACAEEFKCGFMKIFTSMRVMDDVNGGISTFYAEILRIKEMAEYIKNPENKERAVCFIDEIFKGTNSADRIVGAMEAINKLSAGNSMVFVSTHDFELCDLKMADGKEVCNYHFEEYYEAEKLLFDYKLKNGRCKSRNALAILKMAGLCD